MSSFRQILLAEDSASDAELTMEALKESNLVNEIIWVKDGAEALDFLFSRGAYEGRSEGNPALVLLDLKMPRVDGLEVLERMKSSENLRRIPVAILTSSREESDLVRGYDLGVNSYVVKPVDFEAFIRTVSRLGYYWGMLNEPPPTN